MIDRVLIVGLGSIGKRHLRLARTLLPKADIRILRHKVHKETPDLADGLLFNIEDACLFKPQAAIIANPAPFHLSIAIALTEIGCHLLIEKPLSISTRNVNSLLERSQAKNNQVLLGYNLRFLPSLQRFRKLIKSGEIGKILSVRCDVGHYLPSWRDGVDYKEGVSARSELGGGVLLELSHELDYLRWIFGEVSWVNAWLGQQSDLEIDVEDTAHLILGIGTEQTLVCSLNLDFVRRDTQRLCVAIGDSGSLRWNGRSGIVEKWDILAANWSAVSDQSENIEESYLFEWEHFIDCLNKDASPSVSIEDGLAVLKVIDAARKSSDSLGSRLTIDREIH